jgi:hypothetical protein
MKTFEDARRTRSSHEAAMSSFGEQTFTEIIKCLGAIGSSGGSAQAAILSAPHCFSVKLREAHTHSIS